MSDSRQTTSGEPCQEVKADIDQLMNFLNNLSLDAIDEEFKPIETFDENAIQFNKLRSLEENFQMQFSPFGQKEVSRLLVHFENNNNPEYVVRAFAKFADRMADLFVGLTTRKSASIFRNILEVIVTPETTSEPPSTSVTLDGYDMGVIRYVAGYCLHKAA